MKHRWPALMALLAANLVSLAQGSKADYERAATLNDRFGNKVFRDRVEAQWLPGNTSFWYQVRTAPNAREFVLINAVTGERTILSSAPTNQSPLRGMSPDAAPRRSARTGEQTELTFINRTTDAVELFWLSTEGERRSYGKLRAGESRAQNTYAGHVWLAVAGSNTLAAFEATPSGGDAVISGAVTNAVRRPDGAQRPRSREVSPDGKWRALVRDHNMVVRSASGTNEFVLSTDGKDGDAYRERFYWSPDSQYLVAIRVEKGEQRKVTIVESAPKDQLQPKVHTFDYYKPGDKLPRPTPVLFDVAARKQIPISNELFPNFFTESGDLSIRWEKDSSRFTFNYNQRGHQVYRVISVDAASGKASAIVEEISPTFIDYSGKFFLEWLDDTGELIWMSERDGWCHLYLYDAKTGQVKNQITKGEWVVRGVELVDKARREIWFRAGGLVPGEDPYYVHYARVNFDGTGLVQLTEGDGNHSAQFSPDREFLIDTWSRVDEVPVVELRRTSDGKRVTRLERADATHLFDAGWQVPERFVAKGRDGRTDIYGVIIRPTNFDAKKKYPVIEHIYAGPHSAFVPKSFRAVHGMMELAELGFIVVQIDGMGTSLRSKKFHDVAWKNLRDAGFPDRIAWMKAAAARYPEMDLTRVGIYGGSAGGQNSLRGMLNHGDFYKVCVSDCGCHDNRMDKIWWNEQWMGWPVDESYERSSNVVDAHKLTGKLLLIVGEIDRNVDPASTMQVASALVKANKDFELLVMPGTGHGAAETNYGKRRRADFFVRHLLGKEPRWE
jgi:dipeptidyl-peptidase 4